MAGPRLCSGLPLRNDVGRAPRTASCAPETLFNPNGRFVLNEVPLPGDAGPFPAGSATINGVSYPPPGVPFVTFNGDLNFTGGAVALPATPPSEFQSFILDPPFTFTGVLNGYDIFRRDPALLLLGA